MIKKKNKKAGLPLVLMSLCSAVLASTCILPNFADLNSSAFSGSQGGALGYLYDYDSQSFSDQALDAIAKATGKYNDIAELIDAAAKDNFEPIKGSTFGTNTVYFGKSGYNGAALEWIPAYISQAEVDGEKQAILTLWLNSTANTGEYEVSHWSDTASYQRTIQSHLYSASTLHALINNGYTYNGGKYYGTGRGSAAYITYEHKTNHKFVEFSGDGIFSEYIVTPENVAWQMEESAYKNDPANTTHSKVDYGEDYEYNGWTKDNLWVPSVTELFDTKYWGVTTPQRSSSTYNATRSGYTSGYDVFYMYDNGSGYTYPNSTVQYSVRPAFHLNLSLLGKTVKEPSDIVKPYTGSAYSRTDIAGTWYKSNLMDVEWPTNMIDVGERRIKVTLNALAKQKELIFDGTPAADENEYTRYFTFTITKKNLNLDWDDSNYYESATSYFILPTLKITPEVKELLKDNGEVKYYLEGDYDTANKVPTGPAVELKDIQEGKNYIAAVEKIADPKISNYEFTGSFYFPFNTTDGREIIYVSPTKTKDTYKPGQSLPTDVTITKKDGSPITDIKYKLTYKDSEGNTLIGDPRDAGTYTVVVTLQATSSETYKIGEKEFTYVIEQAEPDIVWARTNAAEKLYEGRDLPEIVSDTDNGGTKGTYTPDIGQKMLSGTGNKYNYTFTPDDAVNYKTVTVEVPLDTVTANLVDITAEFILPQDADPDAEPVTVYTSWEKDEIKQYLTVYAVYDNGDKSKITISDRYDIIGGLPLGAGDNTILVEFLNSGVAPCTVEIKDVVESVLEEISSVVKSGSLYTSHSESDLRSMLTVYGKSNDKKVKVLSGNDLSITVDSAYVDENGKLKAGKGIAVTVTYKDGGNLLTYEKFKIDVEEVKLTSLSVEFDKGPYEITATTDIATLLDCLTVKGEYNNGKIEELALDESEITTKVNGTTLTITVTRDGVSESYDVTIPEVDSSKTFTLTVPKLEATFTGEEIDILKDWQFANLIASGDVVVTGNKKTNAGTWDLTITIKNSAYKWPEVAKAAMKYALADGEAEVGYTIEGATLTATWRIAKAVVKGSWNDQGTLDVVCAGYTGDVNALIKYTYYKDGVEVDTTSEPLIVGQKYTVTAELVDSSNFEFDGATAELVSEPHEFTMRALPTGGFTATWNKITEVMVQKYAGLPLWAWLLIGLALLILLIIIIVVACKRKKNKEERKEEKARREEERRMQQERLQAERDLAKAKQEAELEKIKAQAQMAAGMAGMGMASMTMQMPQQQAMPQPQQPVQQQAQPQMQPMVQQMPQSQPVMQQSAPAQASGGVGATEMMAMMFAQFAGMKADNADKEIAALKSEKEITALKTEIEIMKLKLEQMKESKPVGDLRELTPEFLGAALVSAMRGNGTMPQHAVAELPAPETETATSSAVYPPDAVVTTTTTVDTTKFRNGDGVTDKAGRRESRNGKADFDDIDGFYDSID